MCAVCVGKDVGRGVGGWVGWIEEVGGGVVMMMMMMMERMGRLGKRRLCLQPGSPPHPQLGRYDAGLPVCVVWVWRG